MYFLSISLAMQEKADGWRRLWLQDYRLEKYLYCNSFPWTIFWRGISIAFVRRTVFLTGTYTFSDLTFRPFKIHLEEHSGYFPPLIYFYKIPLYFILINYSFLFVGCSSYSQRVIAYPTYSYTFYSLKNGSVETEKGGPNWLLDLRSHIGCLFH